MRRTMSDPTRNRFRWVLSSALVTLAGIASADAQTPATTTATHDTFADSSVSLALTFAAAHANITSPNAFWFYGGGAEVSATLYHGLGASANIVGLHSSNSGGGVPINMLVATFGPRYTRKLSISKHDIFVYGEGLIGEANGFKGVYPQTSGAIPSSNSFALQVGGGLDIGVTRHIAVRALEASWLRSQLPNATTNVQNNIRIGAGVVLHTASK